MDYLPKAIDNGVVDIPPSGGVLVAMNLLSLLWGKAMPRSSKSNWQDCNRAQ